MGNFCYYLVSTLDGYMAREDGSVDWLANFQDPVDSPYDYFSFYHSVSLVVMGGKTWERISSYEENPYRDKSCFVITNNPMMEKKWEEVEIISKNHEDFFKKLRAGTSGRIWVVGGGQLAGWMNEKGILDMIVLTIVPLTLGKGISWMGDHSIEQDWVLTEEYFLNKGLVQLVYSKKR